GLRDSARRPRRALTHGEAAALGSTLPRELAPGEGAVGWVVAHRTPILWTDVATDTRMIDAQALVRAGLASFTAYPIMLGERMLGAFAVHRTPSSPQTPGTASPMASLPAQAAFTLPSPRRYSA